jgi:hypothetical protein
VTYVSGLYIYRDLDRLEDEATPQFTPVATSEHISSLLYLSSLFEATKIPPLKAEAF